MNIKMIAGITLIATIITIAILATPIQAYLNGTTNGDMLQTQDQEKLRTQNRDCTGDCTQTQSRERQRTNECTKNGTCDQTMNMEQFRHQHRERTQDQGN